MKNTVENDNGFFGAVEADESQEDSLKNNGHTVVSKLHVKLNCYTTVLQRILILGRIRIPNIFVKWKLHEYEYRIYS